MQIIFQDVSSSLNPRMTAGQVIAEPMRIHDMYDTEEKYEVEKYELLERVKLGPRATASTPTNSAEDRNNG
jgi:peptide/nickel transport system ATP-binding protein